MVVRVAASLIYSLAHITAGLLLHPYQTMQSLVQERVFVWMTLLPTVVLALITLFWRFGMVPVVRLLFSCTETGFWLCDWLPFLSNWLTFFCVYWQVLLFYLFVRFTLVFRPFSE